MKKEKKKTQKKKNETCFGVRNLFHPPTAGQSRWENVQIEWERKWRVYTGLWDR